MKQFMEMTFESGRYFFRKQSVLISILPVFVLLQGCSRILSETPVDQTTISETVIIESTGDSGIVIAERRYEVLKSTTILDISGTTIPLCDLRVPSEALVEYRLRKDQDPVCVRIENKRLLEGATSLVIEDDPG